MLASVGTRTKKLSSVFAIFVSMIETNKEVNPKDPKLSGL